MINAIQHWTQRHPYTLTGLLFLAMVLFGWTALGWGERQLGFLLLIYFIVALGIRLDEISRTLGGGSGNAATANAEQACENGGETATYSDGGDPIVLYDKIQIAKAVNVQVIKLAEAPRGYKDFDKGAAAKFVLDPHGMIA